MVALMRAYCFIVAALLLAFSGGATAIARTAQATYSNPVIDADFPDPAVLRAPDGTVVVSASVCNGFRSTPLPATGAYVLEVSGDELIPAP